MCDKNSDKLYALDKLIPYEGKYKKEDEGIFEERMTKYRKLWDGARKAMKLNN